ncbi:hypothetical protein RCOM_1691130 [Ricinus communis]|uniref:Uncharacterized protein n=1 Tax=Ricinus communis TaxID=3988 RepID=B9RCP7_RICCO|nr:hypothetical protein RCOM_1691130 [Ricinus communis]
MEEEKKKEAEAANIVWDCGSPLYDSYEIASVGHVIERHMMALPSSCGSKRFIFRPSFSKQEKGVMIKNKERYQLQEEGILSKVLSYLWKRIRIEESNEKVRKFRRSRFYSVGSRNIVLLRKNAAKEV